MKKLSSALIVLFGITACNNIGETEKKGEVSTDSSNVKTQATSTEQPAVKEETFDLNNITVTNDFSGDFPYILLPDGYKFTAPNSYHGKGSILDYDKEYFRYHGTSFSMEGKTFKADLRLDKDNFPDKQFSSLEISKSFDELIASLGGVKINNGKKLTKEEKARLKEEDPDAYSKKYLHSSHNYDDVHTYVIRTPQKTVFLQYNLGSESAKLTVLETKVFENKMSIIPASEIKKQIDADGKAILHINFDTDKATLKADGHQAVKEIAAMLTEYKDLKISIEGYTDNTGTKERNKELSQQRAHTVLTELVNSGIDKKRLQENGFGQEKPIASNENEDGRAKNRRVELVKM